LRKWNYLEANTGKKYNGFKKTRIDKKIPQ
jgi:hypothetical protein